jgi:hypothetical protein
MTPEQLMAIPPQDRIQIQTVVREQLGDSVFLPHPHRREPPLVFHLSSFPVHKSFDPTFVRWT